MSHEQREEGKRWVNSTLLELATRSALGIDRADWYQSVDDVRTGTESLVLESRGQRFVERFPLAQLEDLPGDSGVRNGVEDYLHRLVTRMANPPDPEHRE